MKLKNKIIKIIYPFENGTLKKWFTSNRWDIVTETTTYYVYNYATIRALEIIMDIEGENKK